MPTITESVRVELNQAMRAGDRTRRDALRLIISAFDNARIELGRPLSDEDALRVLQKEAKQRRDSIEEFRKGNRQDLVEKEEAELAVISSFLPQQMSDDELREVVRATVSETGAAGPQDVGKVMRPLMEKIAGRADGRRANEMVREILAG